MPIILITACADKGLVEHATAAGVMGYLVKPVDRRDHLAAIALATARFADFMALHRGDPTRH